MNSKKTSRRQFVQLAGSVALALRHGLLQAQSTLPTAQAKEADGAEAAFGDSSIYLEWDANLHARVSRVDGTRRTPMTSWAPSDYLLRADGLHIARFTLKEHRPPEAVRDANGPGTRLTLSGTAG